MISKGSLYVVSAPSGAGKTSLVNAVVKELPEVQISVSYTTRMMRKGEEDGIDYHFVQPQEFEAMLAKNIFLESAQVFGNYYGTSAVWVEETRNKGIDVILEIDWQGARQVKSQFNEAHFIFILPLSRKILLERLQKRHQDNEKTIQERMNEAREHISHYTEFDYLIVNDEFQDAVEDLKSIIRSGRLQKDRQVEKWDQIIQEIIS